MITSKELLLNMYFAIIGLFLIMTISYFTATKNIKEGINSFVNYFEEFLNFITFKQNRIERVTTSYSNNNFKGHIKIFPRMKGRLLSVMIGVNTLGKALENVAKQKS
jgi:hypothetical protein